MFKKLLGFALVFFFFGSLGLCQTTAVTATITDSDSTVWFNARYTVTFVPNSNYPNMNQYAINGVSLTSPTYNSYLNQSGVTNGSGALAVTLLDNTQISPAGSSWKFTVQSYTSAPSTVYPNVTVSGSAQSLTSFLSSNAVAPRFSASTSLYSGAYGYNTTEISTVPVPGGSFFNTTSQLVEFWNGSSWQQQAIGNFCSLTGCTFTGDVTAPGFIGPLTGNVTGGASLDLPLTGGTLTGPLLGTNIGATGDIATSASLVGTYFRSTVDATAYTGSDACAQINAAMAALPADGGIVDARGLGAGVQVVSTTCKSSNTPAGTQRVFLMLNPATIFEPLTTTTVIMDWEPNSTVDGLSVLTSNVTNYNVNAVEMVDAGGSGNLNNYSEFVNFRLNGTLGTTNGTAIAMAPSSSGLVFNHIAHGTITGFTNGLLLSSTAGFVNANTFDDVNITAAAYCINLQGNATYQLAANIFTSVNCEGNNTTADSITAVTFVYATDNVFQGVVSSDYDSAGQSYLAVDANSPRNLWTGPTEGSARLAVYPGNQIPYANGMWITSGYVNGNPGTNAYAGFYLGSGTPGSGAIPVPAGPGRGITASTYTGSAGGGDLDFWMDSNWYNPAINFADVATGNVVASVGKAGNFNSHVYTVSTLPTGIPAGAIVTVTDATSLTPGVCAGGGTNTVLAVYTGSAWNCM